MYGFLGRWGIFWEAQPMFEYGRSRTRVFLPFLEDIQPPIITKQTVHKLSIFALIAAEDPASKSFRTLSKHLQPSFTTCFSFPCLSFMFLLHEIAHYYNPCRYLFEESDWKTTSKSEVSHRISQHSLKKHRVFPNQDRSFPYASLNGQNVHLQNLGGGNSNIFQMG